MATRRSSELIDLPVIDWGAVFIPVSAQRLTNGLTVLVHREPKSPIVAVYVGYRAGSRDEPRFKAGLAHLCEHMMFSGTKAVPGSYFAPLEQAGAAWVNAFVREDYSAYFATVPADALGLALRMEADRMAHLAETLDDEKVERQREVVRNELLERASQPYGCATRLIAELAHPPDHPYAHPPDGRLEELDNISTDDMREWIATRHVPAGAAVIIVGDVAFDQAVEQARDHFEDIAGSAALPRLPGLAADVAGVRRGRTEQAVKHTRVYMIWNGPGLGTPDYSSLELACEVLAGARNSRLHRRMIEAEGLALEIMAELRPRELSSQIVLWITAQTGIPVDALEAVVRSEIERLCRDGPDTGELEAARLRIFGRLVRDLEHVGGPRSRSEALGVALMAGGSWQVHDQRIIRLSTIDGEAIRVAAQKWLTKTAAVLEIVPGKA